MKAIINLFKAIHKRYFVFAAFFTSNLKEKTFTITYTNGDAKTYKYDEKVEVWKTHPEGLLVRGKELEFLVRKWKELV